MATYYIDIDGTLTDHPGHRDGAPLKERIGRVKKLLADGNDVIIWSAGGSSPRNYAIEFCREHGIEATATLAKPTICVDDKPKILARGLDVKSPTFLD